MRSRSDQLPLFSRARLSEALRAHSANIAKRVQAISEFVLRARAETELVEEIARELAIEPIVVDESRRQMTREEVEIDVSREPGRDVYPRGRVVLVPGVKVCISIPFTGDHQLWHLQPNAWNTSNPLGSIYPSTDGSGGILELVFKQAADKPLENIKASYDRRMIDINYYVNNQASELSGYGSQLRREVASAIADRRARLSKHDGLSQILGIPEVKSRSPESRGAPVRDSRPRSNPLGSSKDSDWDVFVSHASEDKESFARPLADALRTIGLRVWFDEFTLKVGDSLRRSIDLGLARSRFGIVVVSEAFLSKEWPQRELDGLVAREEGGAKVVLPIWHDITSSDIRRRSPTLADRLAIPSSKGVEAVVSELLRVIRPE